LTDELLEQYLGSPNSEKIYNLIARIGDSDTAGTLAAIEDLINSGIGEVQVVDSLIEYMRDLMVIKSTSADSEILALTAEQRKRAGELAEKFDAAALVYNITALEKLRWTLKNSDTPRALLDALLLRFTLSEHFLNVDVLLSQLQGGTAAAVKKKQQSAEIQRHKGSEIKNNEQQIANSEPRVIHPSPLRGYEGQTGHERRTTSRKKNEIINDPAVKTVLIGLDAIITGIEEDQQS
jgi:DNA polymerase III gamma/tau subunit